MQLKKTGRALPRRLFALNTDFWAWKGKMSAKVGQVTPRQLQLEAGICSKIIPGSKLPETAQNDTDARILKIAFQFRESAAVLLLRPQIMIPSQTKNKPDHAATMSDVSKYWSAGRMMEAKATLEVREGLFSQHMRWENSCQFSCQFLSCDMRAMLLEH